MFILEIPQIKEAEKKGCVYGFVSLTEADFEAMKKAHAKRSSFAIETMYTKRRWGAFTESFRFIRKRNIQNNAVRYICFVGISIAATHPGRRLVFDGHFKLHEKDDYLS